MNDPFLTIACAAQDYGHIYEAIVQPSATRRQWSALLTKVTNMVRAAV